MEELEIPSEPQTAEAGEPAEVAAGEPAAPATEEATGDAAGVTGSEPPGGVAEEPAEAAADETAGETARETISITELLAEAQPAPEPLEDAQIKAVLEAVVYVAEEPLTLAQIASALAQPAEHIRPLMEQLVAEFDRPEHGVGIREIAGGFKMATKPEHHDTVRTFVKNLKPPLKLSLPALETLAVVAYKQPVTAPEIMDIRGVQGAGVLKTLLDRKLIAAAGRKNVIGKPILYKTTKEFLIQFGLKDLSELPSLKEFEEIRRMAFADEAPVEPSPAEQAMAEPAMAEPATAEPAEQAAEPATSSVAPAEDAEAAQPEIPPEPPKQES